MVAGGPRQEPTRRKQVRFAAAELIEAGSATGKARRFRGAAEVGRHNRLIWAQLAVSGPANSQAHSRQGGLVRQAFAAPRAFTFRNGSVRTTACSMFTKLSPPN